MLKHISLTANAPTIPLTPQVRAAYQDLSSQLETVIEATTNVGDLEVLNASKLNVDNVLTKDNMYRIQQTSALLQALLLQINGTNKELKILQDQILAISNHIAQAAEVLAAISKVLSLVSLV